ncbi:hypothetical protein DN465_31440 [Burkholderia multivorans]|uniref:triose-phosphate isomerase n=1 Tax=Burkholderia multivorans TaxID=87883 RepID=UPI000DACF33F|nr:hypothetical protein DN465_31440 [Burkholderia multivorans]
MRGRGAGSPRRSPPGRASSSSIGAVGPRHRSCRRVIHFSPRWPTWALSSAQLEESLAGLSAEDLTGLVIAYEPVWAIGTGKTATAEDAAEMAAAIRGWLREIYGDSLAESTRILYGGSVKTDNVADILISDDVDGALVGGASLSGPDFAALCKAAVGQ